ncbi:MAG: hypothetical protein II842_06885 [Butyrivibrio sp.]|nr:hypothetical protein [Butyrivibrio sp.]
MAEIMKIIENYNKSPMGKKIEAILDNYAIFDRIIAGIESDLILDICDERAYCRRKKLGDTGIRVQTSGISDIPFSIVAERDEVERAVKAGDYFTALKGIENRSTYIMRLNTITQLRDDYKIVSSRVGFLNPEDYEIYVRHLTKVRPVGELADEIGLSYDSYKSKIYRYRAAVKKYSVEAMTNRFSNRMAA